MFLCLLLSRAQQAQLKLLCCCDSSDAVDVVVTHMGTASKLADVQHICFSQACNTGNGFWVQVLEIVNDSVIRRLHEPSVVNQGEPKAPDTPQQESDQSPTLPSELKEKEQPQPVAAQA